MTATEVLRRLLDERGMEWDYGITGATTTRFNANGVDLTFTPMRDGLVCSTILTPEQAIAATLGSCNCSNNCTNSERTGTCKLINAADDLGKGTSSCMCFECGYTALDDWWDEFKYCPNCGRRVVQ